MPLPTRARMLLRPSPVWPAVVAAIALTGLGLFTMSAIPRWPGDPDFCANQVRWLPFAAVALILCLLPHPKQIGLLTYPAMIAAAALLVVPALRFMPRSIVPVLNGARHWIKIGSFSLQPSELAKIAFILALARYLRHRDSYRTLTGLLLPFAIMFLPVLLILREPDLGTAVLFPPVLFAVLVAAGARLRHILALLGVGAAVIALSVAAIFFLPKNMQVLEPHQQMRIVTLISRLGGGETYAHGYGYQQDKAMTRAGAGGWTGMTAERTATLFRYNRLPEAANDMIFAVIVARLGWAGGIGVLGLYAVLISSLFWAAASHKDPFARLVFVGFAVLILTQLTINIGMSLGVVPIIGITLPFVSYGGTSLVSTFALLGLARNLAAQPPAIIARPAFEFDRAGTALS
jgi:rod shape determining protein RodA